MPISEPIDYDSPNALQQFFKTLNIAPRKFFGQNFLINRGVREKIVSALNLTPEDTLWEIGPGLGAMTTLVIDKVADLKAFEVDHAYQQILQNFFGNRPNFSLIPGDVLKTFQEERVTGKIKVLGNLPYNIAGAIIQQFLCQPISVAVLMVQKEMAQRMISAPRQKCYSSFSVWTQCHFDIQNHGVVRPNSFYPAPRVDSSIVSLKPRPDISPGMTTMLDTLLRAAFGSRRKTLRNNFLQTVATRLKNIPLRDLEEACEKSSIRLSQRAEEFTPEAYWQCANYLLSSSSIGSSITGSETEVTTL